MGIDELGGWPGILTRLLAGDSLRTEEMEAVLDQVLAGEAAPSQVAGLLVALRAKGETVDEMCGLVRAMLARAEPLDLEGPLEAGGVVAGGQVADVIDMVGTGGDRLRSINVTTLAALVAAGAGARVCKHGNRAQSSSVGTADVLEALGVDIDISGPGVARCVAEAGMGFCFAQRFHPALRHVGPVRRELGIATVFNFLGPLANPARVRRHFVGVAVPEMAPRMAGVLGTMGSDRAMVLYADDGLDELSVTAPSTVLEVRGDGRGEFEVVSSRLDPRELGLPLATMEDLRGGDAAFNAAVIERVLDGERGPRRDIGVLNAAAALVVAGRAGDLASGLELAQASIDDGRAAGVLQRLREVSAEAGAAEREAASPSQ